MGAHFRKGLRWEILLWDFEKIQFAIRVLKKCPIIFFNAGGGKVQSEDQTYLSVCFLKQSFITIQPCSHLHVV